jgi:hypothetical protein
MIDCSITLGVFMKVNATLMLAISGIILSSSGANAAVYPDFTVTQSSVEGFTYLPTIVADKITGNYDEYASFNTANNTFELTLKWNAGQFVGNDGTLAPVPGSVLGANTFFGDAYGYGLYGLMKASGSYSTSNTNATTFNFNAGELHLYIDKDMNTGLNYSGSTNQFFARSNTLDDFEIAFGGVSSVSGQGVLDPNFVTCSNTGINCGSFGVNNDFTLTTQGSQFFTDPVPFYGISLESGQLNSFNVNSQVQHIEGSLDMVYAPVPLPTAAWMFLSGLFGFLSFSRRKSTAS